MGSFLSHTFFKSFSSKYVYVEAATTTAAPSHVLFPVYSILYSKCSHTHMHVISDNSWQAQWTDYTSGLHMVWGSGGGWEWWWLVSCDLWRNKPTNSRILNGVDRNSLQGNRKKIAKFLMRTFACRSTFLYASDWMEWKPLNVLELNWMCAVMISGLT